MHRVLDGLGCRLKPGVDPIVEIGLLGGVLHIRTLVLLPAPDSTHKEMYLQRTIDTLSIDGLSYWSLLRDRVSVDVLRLSAHDLELVRHDPIGSARPATTEGIERMAEAYG